MVTHPRRLNLGIRLFGTDHVGSDLVWQMEKQETSNILY